MFNIGAAPFVSSTLSPAHALTTAVALNDSSALSCDRSSRGLFPWNGGVVASSTPIGSQSAPNNTNHHHYHGNNKDIIELNNRLNAMCGLGPGSAALQSTSIAAQSGLKHPTKGGKAPLPGNVLRHLHSNNNIIMGDLLQETNPPPQGGGVGAALGLRSASDYRAYYNSNLINGNDQLLSGGGQTFMQRPLSNGCTGSNNGLYHYRVDAENSNNNTNNNRQVLSDCEVTDWIQ